MKLIFCPECQDVVRLFLETRTCKCGKAGGKYLDQHNAVYWGHAIPIGMSNLGLLTAINHSRDYGDGLPFGAFVCSPNSTTYRKSDKPVDS